MRVRVYTICWNEVASSTVSFGTTNRLPSTSSSMTRILPTAPGRPAAPVIAERDRFRGPAHPLDADEGLAGIVGSVEVELAAR
jgi:hypothetical protein